MWKRLWLLSSTCSSAPLHRGKVYSYHPLPVAQLPYILSISMVIILYLKLGFLTSGTVLTVRRWTFSNICTHLPKWVVLSGDQYFSSKVRCKLFLGVSLSKWRKGFFDTGKSTLLMCCSGDSLGTVSKPHIPLMQRFLEFAPCLMMVITFLHFVVSHLYHSAIPRTEFSKLWQN